MALLLVVALVDWELVIEPKLFWMMPSVGVLLMKPIPPTHNSDAWIVAGVVPVDAAVLLPVELAALIWSNGLAVKIPLYSITMAAERRLAWVMDTDVTPAEIFGAYQISVVVVVEGVV